MKFIFGVAVLLGTANVALAHDSHRILPRQALSTITRLFTGAPYPTGPGFDVPPLADITQDSAPQPTVSLPVAFPPGTTPLPLGNGASGLPDLSSFDASKYPPLDRIPPTDSPEVQEWLSEIAGVTIPDFAPTKDGTCDSDPAAAAQAGADGRCWWTCTGCTRDIDVVGCPDKERWGLTFDDGPSPYTPKLLTYLQSIDTVATFYMVGSRVISSPATVQAQLMLGHELSVHTWSHRAMTTLTNAQIVAELGWSRKAIKDVTGVTPLTFRPPFGDIDDRVRAVADAMNLTPVMWSNVGAGKTDTQDFQVPSGNSLAPETVNQFQNTLSIVESAFDTGIITLEHDLFQETVDLAIGSTLPDALSRPGPEQRGWKLGTVAQCRGQRAGDAYQETTTNQIILTRLGRTIPGIATSPINSATSVSDSGVAISTVEQTSSPTGIGIPTPSVGPTTTAILSQPPTAFNEEVIPTSPATSSPADVSSTSLVEASTIVEPNAIPSPDLPTEYASSAFSTGTFVNVGTAVDPGNYPLQNALAPTADAQRSTAPSSASGLSSSIGMATSAVGTQVINSPLSFDIKGSALTHVAGKKGWITPLVTVLLVASF